jgi:hypothetical protein
MWRYRYLPKNQKIYLLTNKPITESSRHEELRFMTSVGIPKVVTNLFKENQDRIDSTKPKRNIRKNVSIISNSLVGYISKDESQWVCGLINEKVTDIDMFVQPYEIILNDARDITTQLRLPLWVWISPFACDIHTRHVFREVFFCRPDDLWTYGGFSDSNNKKRPNAGGHGDLS